MRPLVESSKLTHRLELLEGIVGSLRHYPSERAVQIILAWLSIEDLESMYPTVTGRELPDAKTPE